MCAGTIREGEKERDGERESKSKEIYVSSFLAQSFESNDKLFLFLSISTLMLIFCKPLRIFTLYDCW